VAATSIYSRRQSAVVDWDVLRCPDDDTVDTVTAAAAGTRSVSVIARRASIQLPPSYVRPSPRASRVRSFLRRLWYVVTLA